MIKKRIMRLMNVIFITTCLFVGAHSQNSHVVMLSFMPHPSENTGKNSMDLIQGVPTTYFGNYTISDDLGLATFWYEGSEPTVYLLICDDIRPVMAYHNTVNYWIVPESVKAQFYVIQKKYDTSLKLHFWDIQECPMKENRIPLNTIVIHLNPRDVYVPTGIVISNEDPQLVLPTLYVKKGDRIDSILRFTTIRQFFGRMKQNYQVSNDNLATVV